VHAFSDTAFLPDGLRRNWVLTISWKGVIKTLQNPAPNERVLWKNKKYI
jgi:hypothetical protein